MMGSRRDPVNDVVSRWVTFRLDGETYGIDVMHVREVLRCGGISPVPGAPPFVLGIVNLRNDVVSIIDTRRRLGLAAREPDAASRVLILEAGGGLVAGFLVDSVEEVVQLRASERDAPPDAGSAETSRFITGIVSRKEGLLILVDGARLLSETEWSDLTAV